LYLVVVANDRQPGASLVTGAMICAPGPDANS
jgi:hypothetical protein